MARTGIAIFPYQASRLGDITGEHFGLLEDSWGVGFRVYIG